jgi:hypothetical protein
MAVEEQDKPVEPEHGEHGEVTVTVNEKPVRLPKHRVTGREIKEAAIAQGVEIQLDFILVEEAHGGHEAKVIGDEDPVEVTKHSKFTANDGDDNS